MRKTLVTLALAGTLGLTGTALLAPSSALAQAGPAGERVSALKQTLAGLVTDGTITSAQAEQVATALAEDLPRGRHHGGAAKLAQAEVAKALGITEQELRTERRAGQTLAQIAAAQGIEKAELIDRLVTAGKARLADGVADERLTQERADKLVADLEARVTKQVDKVDRHKGGPRGRHGDAAGEDAAPDDASEPPNAPSGS